MHRWEAVSRLVSQQVIGIVRAADRDSALGRAHAIINGGLRTLEIALTTPGAPGIVEELRAAYPDALIGAGTVLDEASAVAAIRSGAQFLVSPSLAEEVIVTGHRYGIPVIPGAATTTEIARALGLGADLIKVFPAASLGPSFIRQVLDPLPHAPLVPVGGVRVDDVPRWLSAGAVACGLGSALSAGTTAETTSRVASLLARLLP